jgi:ABC-type glycerol-3-phosphate transport system substrate-binding protein
MLLLRKLSLRLLITVGLVGIITTAICAAPVEIVVFSTTTHGYERWVQAGLDIFNKQNPDIHASVVTGNADALLTMVAGGQAPDIIHGPGDRYLAQWATQGLIQPLDAFAAADPNIRLNEFVPTILPIMTYQGKLYGLPRNWSVGGIVSNVEMVEARGLALPKANWTWDDMYTQAQKLTYSTKGTGTPDVYGFSGLYANVHRMSAWLWGAGGDFWNEDLTESRLDSPESLEAIRFYEQMWLTGDVSALAFGVRTASSTLMAQGKLGMMHELSQTTGVVVNQNDTFRGHVAPLPIGPAGPQARSHIAIVDFMGMYSQTKHANEAWRVLSFLVSNEGLMAGMDMSPVMGYQTVLLPRLPLLRETIEKRAVEINPLEWINISITYGMRGTTMTHPILGDNVWFTVRDGLYPLRNTKASMVNAAREIARQLNVMLKEALSK